MMMVLVSYDVETVSAEGKTRLRRMAKELESYAQRVQNSVFEVNLDYGSFLKLKDKLLKILDKTHDSLRFYYLGNDWKKKIEHYGVKNGYDSEGFIMF
jgi:CRISPR-associated protein Cas2